MKAFRFVSPDNKGFRLVVLADTERQARDYVKQQAISSLTHRRLKFAGEGHPNDRENWCAAVVKPMQRTSP